MKDEERLDSEDIAEEIDTNEELDNEEVEEESTEKEIAELKNSLARIQADFINFKNRTHKERAQSITLANEELILRLLPIVDDLERALAQDEAGDSFYEGIVLIYNNLIEILKGEGLEEVPSVGEEFDPNFHHAVVMEESDEVGVNCIIETLQKGYILNGKCIRPSMVKVCN